MNERLFGKCLVFAAVGAASMALTACGGSSGGDEAFAAEPQARTSALGEKDAAAATDAQRLGDVAAADAGAASRDPK